MPKTPSIASLERRYERCRQQLSRLGYLSHGSVQDRTGRAGGGSGYQWTRKVAGKTITVALSHEQFGAMKTAVRNYRQAQAALREMEAISRAILFQKHPHQNRQKRLSKKVLGTN